MAFAFITAVTIDHTQCGSADSTNFPVLLRGTYAGGGSVPDLRVTGSGGSVTSSSGYDINFFSDAGATTKLKWEVERYISTTGEIVIWVNIPTLSHTVDTVIYMGYGDAAITTFQGDNTGTWNTAFKAVWHFPDGTTLSLLDSTSNARNGTNVGTVGPVAGMIGGGGDSSAGGNRYMTASDTGLPAGTTDRTFSFWWRNPAAGIWPGGGYSFSLGNFATANQCFSGKVGQSSGTTVVLYDGVSNTFSFAFTSQVWYYITVTWTSTGGNFFVNGVSVGTWTNASQNTTLIGSFYIWETNPAVFNANSAAQMDEFRISNVVRNQSWITSEYNSQKSGATFYAFGTPTPPTGGLPPIVHHLKQQGIM